MTLTRQEALDQLHEWTATASLLAHARAVEVVMRAAASRYGGPEADEEVWAITGLLHDADYERWSDEHPRRIVDWLHQRGEEHGSQAAVRVPNRLCNRGSKSAGLAARANHDSQVVGWPLQLGEIGEPGNLSPGTVVPGVPHDADDLETFRVVKMEVLADGPSVREVVAGHRFIDDGDRRPRRVVSSREVPAGKQVEMLAHQAQSFIPPGRFRIQNAELQQ